MAAVSPSLDFIIDTMPVKHDLDPFLPLLDVDGALVLVERVRLLAEPNPVSVICCRRRATKSLIGCIHETQKLLDFRATKHILLDCEMIRMDEINEAFKRMEHANVRYRFVIDMASMTSILGSAVAGGWTS